MRLPRAKWLRAAPASRASPPGAALYSGRGAQRRPQLGRSLAADLWSPVSRLLIRTRAPCTEVSLWATKRPRLRSDSYVIREYLSAYLVLSRQSGRDVQLAPVLQVTLLFQVQLATWYDGLESHEPPKTRRCHHIQRTEHQASPEE